MKRKSLSENKSPAKLSKNDKEAHEVSFKGKSTPNKNRKSVSEMKSPAKFAQKENGTNEEPIVGKATPKKNRKSFAETTPAKVSNNENGTDELSVGKKSASKKSRKSISQIETPAKIAKNETETNGVSVRDEALPKKGKKQHLIVEKKSDKDLFSINDVPEDVDVVENLNEDDFLESSSEDSEEEASDTESKKKGKTSKDKPESEDSDEEDEDEDSDEEIDEKLIADDDSDEEEVEVGSEAKAEKKKDFGLTSVLVAAPSYIKKKKLEKSISKLDVVLTRCLHIYGNTFLVTCETPAQAQVLLEQNNALQVNSQPLRIFKLPLFVILENLPNFIKAEDVKKAVASCIERSTIKNIVFLHINKCFVEFTTDQAFERFTKKVSKLNISGKTVKVVAWLKKIVDEYSAKCYKFTHLPQNANTETLARKLLENDIKSKDIYQIKFFARNVCTVFSLNDESEEKLLALNEKLEFDKGTVFITLSTMKVILNNLPESISEKKVSKALKKSGINENNVHSIKVQKGKAVVELKTREEEQKVLELDSVLELEGAKIKVIPLSVYLQNAVSVGLLKLPPSTTKTEVLEAFAKVGHEFDEEDVEFEYGEKNSVVFFLNGNEDLRQKLSSLNKLSIVDGDPTKVTFCKFGSSRVVANSTKKFDRKRVFNKNKQKKHNQKMNKIKRKKKEKEEADKE